jgi:hypothetical protein
MEATVSSISAEMRARWSKYPSTTTARSLFRIASRASERP